MDLWVVVAGAATGYLAKYWQNLSRDRDNSPELSSGVSNFDEKPESPSSPFRRLAGRKKLGEDGSTDRKKVLDQRISNMYHLDGASEAEVASTSKFDGDKLGSLGNNDDCNVCLSSSLPSRFSINENLIKNEGGNGLTDDFCDNSCNRSMGEIDFFGGSARNRISFRPKRPYGHSVKPQSSLESCLMAQLYKEHVEIEEYVLSALPSPSTPRMRPLLVTDGSRIISVRDGDSFSAQIGTEDKRLHKGSCLEKSEIVFGVPALPKIGPLDPSKKIKKTEKGHSGRLSSSSKMGSGKHFHLQGSDDGTVLFCLGISVGIVSSLIANRREVDKLKELLKQTENLVQDLQDELEMKDSLTVKELANENYKSLDTCDNSFHDRVSNTFSPEQNMDNLTKYYGKESLDKKAEKSSESMSKIEAELEAELERLGLNMNTSSLERRLSNLVELDPDFVADFAQGELRADMINDQAAAQAQSNQDASSTSTTHSGNHAISPHELSLRLHEVIQSRLEQRVEELETALQNSQQKVQLMESERKYSWRKSSNGDRRYFSTQESPIAKEECHLMAQPLVMNLSGEALDAYNEAYEELMKVDESEEVDSPSMVHENNQQVSLHPFDQSISWGQNGGVNGFLPHLTCKTEKIREELFSGQVETSEEHSSRVQELLDVGVNEDEIGDCDDEMEKQLIKQIVEKTKKGSPVVLNAQKLLFSIDEIEH